jgi:hemerythrin-like domain-containing protein
MTASAQGATGQGGAGGGSGPIDVSDMFAVHQALRDTLAAGPARVRTVDPGDPERLELIADYYDNVLWFLHVHHEGEEALVFPKLRARCPEAGPLMDAMVGQHEAVVTVLEGAGGSLAAWRAGDAEAQEELAAQLAAMHGALVPHLDTEEADVLPLCADNLSAEEWGALPGHALSQYSGDKVWLILGLILERRTPEGRVAMMSAMPPPVAQMWTGQGREAFEDLAARVG